MLKNSILALGLTLSSVLAVAQPAVEYEVIITNITPGQTFTPQLVVTHPQQVQLFNLGDPASEELEILAEAGNTQPLTDAVVNIAMDVQTIPGLLEPGQSSSITVIGHPQKGYISVVAMMIPTNDTFIGLNRVPLPRKGTATFMVPAYDAGTEFNDQSCQNMPGPACGIPDAGYSPESGEGYVHIGNGFHDLGDVDEGGFVVLGPQTYDWRNSVARITVTRIRN
jgi:hypothetical protein